MLAPLRWSAAKWLLVLSAVCASFLNGALSDPQQEAVTGNQLLARLANEAQGAPSGGRTGGLLRANSPLLNVPDSLARYFFYGPRADGSFNNERQATITIGPARYAAGEKRASQVRELQLDPLSGVSLGKRSVRDEILEPCVFKIVQSS